MLFEQQKLVKENNQWQLTVEEISVPSKIKDIIYRRIDFLEPSKKKILDAAAVAGEKFDPSLVAAVVAQDSIDVLESLNDMANNTLLVHCEDDHYWFSHAKYREMLYEKIPPLLKKEYHLRIAKILEKRSSEELPVNDLAHHYAEGGNKQKSVEYALLAGNLALSRFSNNEALTYFSYALKNTVDKPQLYNEKNAATEGLGEAYFADAQFELALKTFEELGDSTEGISK
jgi:adenylate cyclase